MHSKMYVVIVFLFIAALPWKAHAFWV